MKPDKIFEILSEPDIIKGGKLSGKKVRIKWDTCSTVPQHQVGAILRLRLKGQYGSKAMRMSNVLDELARRFSKERNISQREMFEVALIEFFMKYGYRDEVEKYLLG